MRGFLAAVLFLLFALLPVPPAAAAPVTCRGHYLPVTHQSVSYRVFGEFCRPARLGQDTPVQLLLHGATYNHTYWSAYARLAASRGYATFSLDRLGYGRSDHPDPATLDLRSAGDVAHQVVNRLRGGVFGPRFTTVVLNAHSLGGLVAHEAARLGGVSAMIISGMPAGAPETRAAAEPFPPFYPAEQDPRFAGLPSGYLTTMPGTRAETFLYPGTYHPAVSHVEEELLKDTVPLPEFFAIGTPPAPVDVPTLSVLGQHDMFYCWETADCTTSGPAVDAVIPDAGHSVNMSYGAARFYALTFTWLSSTA